MVKPWVMMGSSSGGLPFQQSSSRQRQPDNRHWRYISGEDTPENWPAAWVEDKRPKIEKITYLRPSEFKSYEDLSATLKEVWDLSGMCCGRTWWSSGVWVGSCPDTWPACPAWRLMSPALSGNLRGLPAKSDLQKENHTKIVGRISTTATINDSHFCWN